MKPLATLIFLMTFSHGIASAQQQFEKPMELEAVGRYVGDWTSEVTSRPAEWTPHAVNYRCQNHAELILDGWFLQHIEVNHIVGEPDRVTKSLFLWTFDVSSGKYVGWSFQSTGNISKVTGTWDAASRTFSHLDANPPASTTVRLTETFVSDNSINGSLAFTRIDGLRLFDMVWTRTRQKDVAANATQSEWAAVGTPIEPIPDEVKKLELFVGTRDVEFIHGPSLTVPQGSTTKGTMSGRWILDGRFLLGETMRPDFQSQWVIGYDTNIQAFRYVLFGSNGRIDENIGQWNEAGQVFDWKLVDLPSELTRTSTTRRLDQGRVESHIVHRNQDGQVQMDLTIKATPKQ